MLRWKRAASRAAIWALLFSCRGRDDLGGERRALPGLARAPESGQETASSRDVELFEARALAMATIAGTLFLSAGALGFELYSDGGRLSTWHRREIDGEPAAVVDGYGAELLFPLDDGIERRDDGSLRIAWRGRPATPEQLVSVFLNGRKLGDIAMPSARFESYSVIAPASALVEGENFLRFYFRDVGELGGVRSAAAFTRIAVGGKRDPALPGPESGLVTAEGRAELAFTLPEEGRLSISAAVPADALALSFAATGGGHASLRIVDDRGEEMLWSGELDGGWRAQEVDLRRYRHRLVRFDFVASGAASWGRPRILREPPRPAPSGRAVDHIVLWSVSSLGADDVFGSAAPPPYRRFAGRGLAFSRASAASPSAALNLATAMAGRRLAEPALPEGVVPLAETMRRAGYATALFSGRSAAESEILAPGFELIEAPRPGEEGASTRALLNRVEAFLTAHRGQRTFVVVAGGELDLGACAVMSGNSTGDGGAPSPYRACLEGEAKVFADFAQTLEAPEWSENIAAVLIGDGGAAPGGPRAAEGALGLAQARLHIPMVIFWPGVPSSEISHGVELVDLHPTLLQLAGAGAGGGEGRSLFELDAEGPVFALSPGVGRSIRFGDTGLFVPDGGRSAIVLSGSAPSAAERPISAWTLRMLLALYVSYAGDWNAERWGEVTALRAAFAGDVGL